MSEGELVFDGAAISGTRAEVRPLGLARGRACGGRVVFAESRWRSGHERWDRHVQKGQLDYGQHVGALRLTSMLLRELSASTKVHKEQAHKYTRVRACANKLTPQNAPMHEHTHTHKHIHTSTYARTHTRTHTHTH